jgi:hypothetical protein
MRIEANLLKHPQQSRRDGLRTIVCDRDRALLSG